MSPHGWGILIAAVFGQYGILAWFLWSMKREAQSIAEMADEKVMARLNQHAADPYAHPQAAAHYHGAMEEELKQIKALIFEIRSEVVKLRTEHELLVDNGTCHFAKNGKGK